MSADPGRNGRPRAVPTPEDDGHDDGYWCSTSTTTLPGPTGEIAVLSVHGQLDLATLPVVAAALDRTLDRPLGHVVLSLAGLAFCAARGLDMFVEAGGRAAERGIGYSASGASMSMRQLWSTLWPSRQPAHYPTVGSAVIAALGHRSGRPSGPSPIRPDPAVYRITLHALARLDASDDLAPVIAHDIAVQLRDALASLQAVDPD